MTRLIVLLSVKAGLRAGEIAKLTWDMVLDPTGEIGDVIELRDWAAKKGSGRLIPIHPRLRAALAGWQEITDGVGPVVRSERGNAMRPVSIVNWFADAYSPGSSTASHHDANGNPAMRSARAVAGTVPSTQIRRPLCWQNYRQSV
jgi:integrase